MTRLLCLAGALALAACVKDDPIVTGNRDASTADAATPASFLEAGADDPNSDAPNCQGCGDALGASLVRAPICSASAKLVNAVVDCACNDKCKDACGTWCSGAQQSVKCTDCLGTSCGDANTACKADAKDGGA